ncbi:hypothetical protein LTR66_014700, partial [Elasticomyces elasticus]
MSAAIKKPPTPGGGVGRRPSVNPPTPSQSNRSPSRASAQTLSMPPANSFARARSIRGGSVTPISARAAAKKPSAASSTVSLDVADDDAGVEMAILIEDLKEHLQQAEQASEEYLRQVAQLQAQLDRANQEQNKLEENVHEHTERIQEMQNEQKESLRLHRERESVYEAQRASTAKERVESQAREEELHTAIKRLKETLAQRDLRGGLEDDRRPNLSRASSWRSNQSPNPENGMFAPPSSVHRSDSRDNSKLMHQKDKIIESLQLELAEAQIKLAEVENRGGGHTQELERQLIETRMANARLMEDNESFQLLLSEKTLNGDFANSELLRPPSSSSVRPSSRNMCTSSLADELGSVDASDGEDTRRLLAEVASLKDQNKALTLFINRIIERVLQHDGLESVLDKTTDLMSRGDTATTRRAGAEKDLPVPPPEKLAPPSFLQRA